LRRGNTSSSHRSMRSRNIQRVAAASQYHHGQSGLPQLQAAVFRCCPLIGGAPPAEFAPFDKPPVRVTDRRCLTAALVIAGVRVIRHDQGERPSRLATKQQSGPIARLLPHASADLIVLWAPYGNLWMRMLAVAACGDNGDRAAPAVAAGARRTR
jgi:hypothetical protein